VLLRSGVPNKNTVARLKPPQKILGWLHTAEFGLICGKSFFLRKSKSHWMWLFWHHGRVQVHASQTLNPWASEEFFQAGPIVEFSSGSKKDFPGWGKSCKIWFFYSKPRKRPFSLKIYKENVEFQIPGGQGLPSKAHDLTSNGATSTQESFPSGSFSKTHWTTKQLNIYEITNLTQFQNKLNLASDFLRLDLVFFALQKYFEFMKTTCKSIHS